jgi:hypothetical protein
MAPREGALAAGLPRLRDATSRLSREDLASSGKQLLGWKEERLRLDGSSLRNTHEIFRRLFLHLMDRRHIHARHDTNTQMLEGLLSKLIKSAPGVQHTETPIGLSTVNDTLRIATGDPDWA